MNIPKYARYDYCNRKACEFLEEYNIISFPIDVEKIIHDNKWGLIKYSEIMQELSCDLDTVIRCLRSRDGYTQLDDTNYSIAYNDATQLGNRKRFTLMHEIGHIYLRHLTDFGATVLYRGSLTKKENQVLENEANAFARNVLVPSMMIQQLKNKSISNIAKQFGITPKAAQTRINFYQRDCDLNETNAITPRLLKIFTNFYYKKRCLTCGYSISKKVLNFCPICGENTLVRGGGNMNYLTKIEVNGNSKAIHCPVCSNNDIASEGNYCQICGTDLVNRCTNIDEWGNGCGSLAAGNARYCIYCGAETTFYQNGLLKSWEKEPAEQEAVLSKAELDDLNLIRDNWDKIICDLGGAIRPSFRETVVEPIGDHCLCIIFPDQDSYVIGNRPTLLRELETYIENHYGKSLKFKTRRSNQEEGLKIIRISEKDIKEAIHLEIDANS